LGEKKGGPRCRVAMTSVRRARVGKGGKGREGGGGAGMKRGEGGREWRDLGKKSGLVGLCVVEEGGRERKECSA